MGANKVPPHHLVYSQPWTLSYGWKFVGISNNLIADTADTVYPQMPHFQLAIFVYRSQLFVYRSSRLVISQQKR